MAPMHSFNGLGKEVKCMSSIVMSDDVLLSLSSMRRMRM